MVKDPSLEVATCRSKLVSTWTALTEAPVMIAAD
jgi:hypothetical protein